MAKKLSERKYLLDQDSCCGFHSNQETHNVQPSRGILPDPLPSITGNVCCSLGASLNRLFFALSVVDASDNPECSAQVHDAAKLAHCNNLGILKNFYSKDYYQGRQDHSRWQIPQGLPEAIIQTGVNNARFMLEAEGLWPAIQKVEAVMRVDSTSDLNLRYAERICSEWKLPLETRYRLKKKLQGDFKNELIANLQSCFGKYKSRVSFELVQKVAKTQGLDTRLWAKSQNVRASVSADKLKELEATFTPEEIDEMGKLSCLDGWRIQLYRWAIRVDVRDNKPMSWNKAVGLNPRIASLVKLSIFESNPELEAFIKGIKSILLVEDDGRGLITYKSLVMMLRNMNRRIKIYGTALFDARQETAGKTRRLLNWYRTYQGEPITNRQLTGAKLFRLGMPKERNSSERKLQHYSTQLKSLQPGTATQPPNHVTIEYGLLTPFSVFIAQRREQFGQRFVYEQFSNKGFRVWIGSKYERSINLAQFQKRKKMR